MAVAWAVGLPSGFLLDKTFQRGGHGNTIRNETVSGRVKTMRVSTKTHRVIDGAMAMTTAQLATFETFYRTTIEDGSLPFQGLTNPFTGANTVWLFLEDPVETSYPMARGIHEVKLKLLALPDAPT